MSKEFREGTLLGHYPCFQCGGSDPLAVYEKEDSDSTKLLDGYCFSCNTYVNDEEISANVDLTNPTQSATSSRKNQPITQEELDSIQSLGFCGWRDRKITTTTSKRYGVHTKLDQLGNVKYRYYPSTVEGEIVGYHVRNDFVKQARKVDKTVKGAPFFAIGIVKNKTQLFGQCLFPKGGKYLVITGGEEDAMAVHQVLKKGEYETPVVSPTVGEGNAKQQIQENFEYVNSFQKVVLMLDNDKTGREAAREITKMFGFGKVVIADLIYKDPCEYLKQQDGVQQLRKAFWEAMPKKPSQVLSVADIYEKAMQLPEMGLSFPWPSATKATLGIRRGEIHIVGAAPKIGKTEHQHQLIKHMTDVHGERIGVMSLEENPVKTLKKVAGKYAKKQFTKPPEVGGYTMDEMKRAFDLLDDKMEFYSSDGVRDYNEIIDTVRYWASKGIWFFILDPLTALVAEHSSSEANDILNNFMSKAASLCMELGVTFFMYSHVNPVRSGTPHDLGGDVISSQFTGSRAMEKWSHYGWGIQRNRNEKDPVKRNTARITMLFDREFGEYCEYFCYYDSESNDWSEVTDPEAEVFGEEEPVSETEDDFGHQEISEEQPEWQFA